MDFLSHSLLTHKQILHMNTLVHIDSMKNGPNEAEAVELTVMQREDWLGVGL